MGEENQLFKTISDIVDAWVSDLVKRLISRDSMAPKRGLWDRFKGGISNLVYGRDNKSNPYYWRNRFGDDLGVEESFFPGFFTLSEYGKIRFFVEEAEKKVSEALLLSEESSEGSAEKLKIVRILRAAGEDLKNKLSAALAGKKIPKADPAGEAKGKRDARAPTTTTTAAPTASSKAGPTTTTTAAPTTTTTAAPTASSKAGPTTTTTAAPTVVAGSSEDKKKARKGSFGESLEETLELVRGGRKSSIAPDKSWMTSKGNLSDAAVPKVVAWLGMKTHMDIADDEKVKEELRKALTGFKGFTSRKENTLLKILKQYGVEKEVMSELGASEEAIEKLTPKETAPLPPPPEDSEASDPLEKLYGGKESYEEIMQSVEKQLIEPMLLKMGKEAYVLGPKSRVAKSQEKLANWWESIKKSESIGQDKDKAVEFVKNNMLDSILSLSLDNIYDADDILKYMTTA